MASWDRMNAGVGWSGQVGSRAGEAGCIDSAIQLKFMCSLWSVNPSPLPPFGTTGQRWRISTVLDSMRHSAGQYARDTDTCSLKLSWEPTAKVEQQRGDSGQVHPAPIYPHSSDLRTPPWVWRWIFFLFWLARRKFKDWFMCATDHLLCVPPSPRHTHFCFATAFYHHPSDSVRAKGARLEFIEVIVPGVRSAALGAQEVPASAWLHRKEMRPEFTDHINRKKFPCSMKQNSRWLLPKLSSLHSFYTVKLLYFWCTTAHVE